MIDAMKVKEALVANLREAWAALAMIRETVETLGPVGAMKASEHLDGPTFMHEAEAIVEGIRKLAAPSPAALDPVTVEALKHERNVLQKICARRADIIEALGHPADITLEEIHALLGPSAPSGDSK
jgi:hypothetical protein